MKSIQDVIETALASTSPFVRICLTLAVTAATMMLAMHAGTSIGKALYYLTH